MSEWRIPGDIDVTFQQFFNLTFVIREQREIHRHVLFLKVFADAFPDRHDLGIVGDGAEKDCLVVSHLFHQRAISFRVGLPPD